MEQTLGTDVDGATGGDLLLDGTDGSTSQMLVINCYFIEQIDGGSDEW